MSLECLAACTTVEYVDAFERLVSDARDRLSAREGSTVSWRELVRRAGFDDASFGRVSYHLLPRARPRGHHVPTWLIDALTPVLPVSRADLMRAAAEAAGYDMSSEDEKPDGVVVLITRVLNDENVEQSERDRIGLEVMAAITRAMQRERRAGQGG